MSPATQKIIQRPWDPIVQLQLLLMVIFVLYFCGQTIIEHVWMNRIQSHDKIVANERARRDIGVLINGDIVRIELDCNRILLARNPYAQKDLLQETLSRIDHLNRQILPVLQHGGSFNRAFEVNQNEMDVVNETFSYDPGAVVDIVVEVIELQPRLHKLKSILSHMFTVLSTGNKNRTNMESIQVQNHSAWVDYLKAEELTRKCLEYSNKIMVDATLQLNQIQMENQLWLTQLTWYKKTFYFSLQTLILIIVSIIFIRIIRIQNERRALARERETLMAEKNTALVASQESNAMLEKIISHLPVGILLVGQDKKIMQLNAEAERILGYDVGEGYGCLKGLDCHTHCNIPRGQCPIYDLKETNIPLGERLILRKDHSVVSVLKSVIPVLLNGQEVLLEAIMDISSVKAAEQAILEAKQAAESANQAKSRFLANMGHEIRTPLNAILGFSDILLARETSGEVRSNLTIIAKSGHQLLGMINNILDYSKLEAGEMTLDNQPFALLTLLHQIPELFSDQAQAKSLIMEVMIDKTVPRYLMGDEIKIRQIFMNLVGNAVKFSDHGKILIHAHSAGSGIVFKIHDSGVGIPREKLEAVFHPFEQADGAMNRKYGGAGLGLSLSLSLVKLMGGKLSVTSNPGKGSVFIISLPLAAVPEEKLEKESIPSHGRMPGAEISPGRELKGLVVEDHPGNLKLTETMLQRMGIHSQGAINGQIALSLMEKTSYDFVLMDVHMPVMDGLETLEKIRQHPLWQNIPVLAVTGYVTEKLREEFMAVGFDDFISKPFTRELLYEKLSILFPNFNQIDSQVLSPSSVSAQERLPNNLKTVVEDEKELAEMALEMVQINLNLFNPDEIEGVARMVLDSSGDAGLQDMARRLIRIAQDFDEEGLHAMLMELEILLGLS